MMPSIMLSLPVRNLAVSQAFFTELGLTFSPQPWAAGCSKSCRLAAIDRLMTDH